MSYEVVLSVETPRAVAADGAGSGPDAGAWIGARRRGYDTAVWAASTIGCLSWGAELDLEQGREAARVCALNCLAALLTVIDSLDAVKQLIRVGVFVNSAAGFNQQPAVANGASDLFVEVFGDRGRHARTAVGVNELPLGFAVEVELIVEV